MFIDSTERGRLKKREREGDRETLIGCLLKAPQLGIEVENFLVCGMVLNQLSHLTRAGIGKFKCFSHFS